MLFFYSNFYYSSRFIKSSKMQYKKFCSESLDIKKVDFEADNLIEVKKAELSTLQNELKQLELNRQSEITKIINNSKNITFYEQIKLSKSGYLHISEKILEKLSVTDLKTIHTKDFEIKKVQSKIIKKQSMLLASKSSVPALEKASLELHKSIHLLNKNPKILIVTSVMSAATLLNSYKEVGVSVMQLTEALVDNKKNALAFYKKDLRDLKKIGYTPDFKDYECF